MTNLIELEQMALAAGTWIRVPDSTLEQDANRHYWLLHHNYVSNVVETLTEEFSSVATVLRALLATGIGPNHEECFVDNTWIVGVFVEGNSLTTLNEELACGLVVAMSRRLDDAVLTSVTRKRYCRSLFVDWLEQDDPSNSIDMDVWGEVMGTQEPTPDDFSSTSHVAGENFGQRFINDVIDEDIPF